MLRWIFYFAMLFLSRRTSQAMPSVGDIVQSVTEKIQTAIFTALAGFFLLILAIAGFVTTLFVLAGQYDRDGSLSWSATLSVSIGLLVVPLLAMLFSGLRLKQTFRPVPAASPSSTGLPKAIEDFAMEWLKDQAAERRSRRQNPPPADGMN